jgi:phage terminase large subunit
MPSRILTGTGRSLSGVLRQEELDAARKDMSPEQYAAEFEVSFDAAIIGSYYGTAMASLEARGHMLPQLLPEQGIKVNTAWDLGIGDSTAIWFWQAVGKELRIIDFYENHGKALPHYVAGLQARGYSYGTDFVPHDAKVRELSTGRTRIETLISLGRRPYLVPAHKLADGINASRITLENAWFDATKCHDGIEALHQYRRSYDDKAKVFSNTPIHNFASHPADAFRMAAMAWRQMVEIKKPEKPKLFIPTEELTINDWVIAGNEDKKRRQAAL